MSYSRIWPTPERARFARGIEAHANPSLDQDAFRGRNDDGSETAATWKASVNTDWTQETDANFRVRFLIQETAGGSENNVQATLQYNLNGAGWNDVTGTSSVVQSSDSTHLTDGEDTTQQIGSGTFITPNGGVDDLNGVVGESNELDFGGNDEVEIEFCLQLLSADVADSDTVQLRVVRGDGTVLESYTNTPTLTASVPTADSAGQVSWAEIEAPDAPRGGQLSWGELETGDAPRSGQLSWGEVEVPTAPRSGQLSWAEAEAPDAPRSGQVSWSELAVPETGRTGQLSWSEMEVADAPRSGQVSWSELETPSAGRSGQLSWGEIEAPDAPRAGNLSWSELSVPESTRRGHLSWSELEAPDSPRAGHLSWGELEAPSLPRGHLSWVRIQFPNVPGEGRRKCRENEIDWGYGGGFHI